VCFIFILVSFFVTMIDDRFRIYTEQLREGCTEEIEETLSPDFLEINERDLAFNTPVKIQGQAYFADDLLVIHLDIEATATLPCVVCNASVDVPLEIKGFYHAAPQEEIKNGVYDFREILRETILLETPLLAECKEGNCPERPLLGKFFKKEDPSGSTSDEGGYQPFADLDFDAKDKS